MKRNIIAGAVIILFSLCSISCNNTTDNTGTDVTDTMTTMPAAMPEHADTPLNAVPPAVVDTTARHQTRNPDSMPER